MTINHRILRPLVAFGIGFAVAFYAYERVTDPRPRLEREKQEAVVRASRDILRGYLESTPDLQIVDPLAPDRKVGKVYIYPADQGWEVSGHYRRSDRDRWHAYLMRLDAGSSLVLLSVRDDDARLQQKAGQDPRLETEP